MKKISLISAVTAMALLISAGAVFAQTVMPVLYNSSGIPVNTGTASVAPGYYYVGAPQSSGGDQVYYYGNGTYYDASTMTYGGSVSDPNGTSGAALGGTFYATPGVPNTGAGGNAPYNWVVLTLSAAVFLGSATYIVRKTISA